MIYMDNAATSYPKPQIVLSKIMETMQQPLGNPGRGSNEVSLNTTKLVYKAREKISEFFDISDPTQLIFTKNATESLNIAIFGVLKPDDHVIITSMEHNSVIRPIMYLKSKFSVKVSIVWANKQGIINIKDIEKSICSKTKLIVMTFSSNVTGIANPVSELGKLCNKKRILFLLDASQGAGNNFISVKHIFPDLMAFPGHKSLFGPQGIGCLYIRKGLEIDPFIIGGTGSISESIKQPEFLPDRFESGTLNVPGIIGLMEGINFINQIGINIIKEHKIQLIKYFLDGLRNINGIKVFSNHHKESNTGIVSLNFKDVDSGQLSELLDKNYNIKTRSGLHCAPLAHKTLGTSNTGLVRFSFSYFNNLQEINFCLDSLKEISKSLSNVI